MPWGQRTLSGWFCGLSFAYDDDDDVHARICLQCRGRLGLDLYTRDFFVCDTCLDGGPKSPGSPGSPVLEEDVAEEKSLWGLEELGHEEAAWPTDPRKYVEFCPQSSRLEPFNRFREFTMGAKGISREDYKALEVGEGEEMVMHKKVYLLTERLDEIRLYIRKRKKKERLVGLLVGTRDSRIPIGIASAQEDVHGGVDKDGYDVTDPHRAAREEDQAPELRLPELAFGKRRASMCVRPDDAAGVAEFAPDREEILRLPDSSPFLKRIRLQQTVWGKRREKLQKRISYLCLEGLDGKQVVYGQELPPSARAGELVYPPEVAEGVLAIVGVGICGWHPLSFQVVDVGASPDPANPRETETVFYGGSRLNNVCVTEDMARYERGYTVVVEKTEVLALLDELAQAILTTAPCSAALLPSATPLLQDCVAEDQALISAVFRMNRSLTHMIQDGAAVGGFPGNNWRNVIPLKRMAASLASGLVPIKRATLTQPGVDVYMYAMLTQERKDIMKAVIVSVSQIILMATLSLGIDISSFGAEFHSIVFSVIISFVVVFAVTRQVEQHQICRKVFGFSYWPGNGVPFCITLMAWLDFLANVVFAWMLFVMSFLLLMCTTEYLELALNSTATLFILEVDEMVINVEIDELHGLYLQRCFETVTNIVMEVTDFRYWQGWKRLQHDKTCRINRKHCALVWPRQD